MNHFRLECGLLHPWQDIDRGENTPNEFIAVIEIPLGSNIKHELGKESGIRKRFNHARVIHVTNKPRVTLHASYPD